MINARIWFENGCTLKTVNYEGIMRNFGVEEANRVFPQDKNKEIPELNEFVTRKIEDCLLSLIDTSGFATEKQVIENVVFHFKGQQLFKLAQLKRCLGEILEKYCLTRIRLNKFLKEQLKIEGNGYPFVILYEKDLNHFTEKQVKSG